MPSLDQVMVASREPSVPDESAVFWILMSSSTSFSFMPLASRIWLPAVSTLMSLYWPLRCCSTKGRMPNETSACP